MVAARDGRLEGRQRHALDRHLTGCEACREAAVSTEDVLALLARLPSETEVPARLEQQVLRRVRILAADDADGGAIRRLLDRFRLTLPAVAAGAVAAVAFVAMRGAAPAPIARSQPVHVASPAPTPRTALAQRTRMRAPTEPPAELAARPDLFVDLPILRNLDKLQHFDTIATMNGDDAGEPPHAEPPSNG